MRKNILRNKFSKEEKRLKLLNIFKELLLTGDKVSYDMVLRKYNEMYVPEYNPQLWNRKYSETENNILKTIIHEIRIELNKIGHPLIECGKKDKTYQYNGPVEPFKNIEFRALIEERKILFTSFIKEKKAVEITYKPFDKRSMLITFHPQLLYEYNRRLFVFGVSEMKNRKPFRKFCIALDRIEGDIKETSTKYIKADTNEYHFLNQIVGVTLEENSKLTNIRLRAHDLYTFGRITTKPIHDSQRVVIAPDKNCNRHFGEVELLVYPNNELIGQILSYGSTLQVLSPAEFKQRVIAELNKTIDYYKEL